MQSGIQCYQNKMRGRFFRSTFNEVSFNAIWVMVAVVILSGRWDGRTARS